MQSPSEQNSFFKPYTWILREGTEIQQDLMDYNLVLISVTPCERLHSPIKKNQPKEPFPALQFIPSAPNNLQLVSEI